MSFRLSELKQLIQDKKATLEKVQGGHSDELGGIDVPDKLKVTVKQFDRNTGEPAADKVLEFTKDDLLERKAKLEDDLAVVNQGLNKLK